MKRFLICLFLLGTGVSSFSQEKQPNFHEIGFVFSNLNSFGLRYKYGNDNTLFRITSLVINGTNSSNSFDNYSGHNTNDTSKIPSSISATLGLGVNLGIEKRIWINPKSFFLFGVESISTFSQNYTTTVTPGSTSFGYTDLSSQNITLVSFYNNSTKNDVKTVSTGLGFVFGYSYKFNDIFSIVAELEPSITYKYSKTNASSISNSVNWDGSSTVGYFPAYTLNNTSQTTINKGITYGLTNTAVNITLVYKLKSKSAL